MFIDVHCHLDFYSEEKIEQIIKRAKEKNVKIILTNGTNPETNRKSLELAKKYPEVKCALGVYLADGISMGEKEIEKEIKFIRENKNKINAVGEVGLDLKEDFENFEKQKKVFEKLIFLSIEIDKPIIVHSRKAEKECIEMLENAKAKKVIMHCFSGKMKLVEKILENKWFVSIPALVVYSEHFQNVVRKTPLSQLICETDSPFLHPFKEKENEPFLVVVSYKKISEIKNLPLKEVEKQIEKNYEKLFS